MTARKDGGRRSDYKPELRAQALALRAEGLLPREIGERLGVSRQRVNVLLRQAGVQPQPRPGGQPRV